MEELPLASGHRHTLYRLIIVFTATPSSLYLFFPYFSQKFYFLIKCLHAWFHIGIFFPESCIVILAMAQEIRLYVRWGSRTSPLHCHCQEELHPMWMWGMESLLLGDING